MQYKEITNDYSDIIKAKNGNKDVLASLIDKNMGLVYSITKRFIGRGYELEDLNQIGIIGLIKAIKNFDTNYDVKLSTYSVPYILGEVRRFIRDDGQVKVSRSLKELSSKINILKNEYLSKKGIEITIDEIAKELNVSKDEIVLAIDATSANVVTSINEPIFENNDGNICLGDMIKSEKNEENEITNKISIQELLKELSDREREIIVLRYFKGDTQTQISKVMGISQVQISRIEKKVLLEMRKKIC